MFVFPSLFIQLLSDWNKPIIKVCKSFKVKIGPEGEGIGLLVGEGVGLGDGDGMGDGVAEGEG